MQNLDVGGLHLPGRGAHRRGHRDQERPAQAGQRKVLPGYILVRMELNDESWSAVRNTPGVTGFVGATSRPSPLSLDEVVKFLLPQPRRRSPARPPRPQVPSRRAAERPASRSTSRSASRSPSWTARSRRCRPRSARSTPNTEAQGAGLHLRPRDPGRADLQPGRQDLAIPRADVAQRRYRTDIDRQQRRSSNHGPEEEEARRADQAADPGRAGQPRPRRSVPRSASTASTSWSSARRTTPRPSRSAATSSRWRSPSTRTALHLHAEDPAGRPAAAEGRRRAEGLRRAAQDQGRHGDLGPGPRDRRDQEGRPQRQRHRRRVEDHRRHRPVDGHHRRD